MAEGSPGLIGSGLIVPPSRAEVLMPISMEEVAGEGLNSTREGLGSTREGQD